MIGRHAVTVRTPVAGSAPVDVSCLVDAVSIHHGRDDTDSQPEASSCSLDLSFDTSEDALPSAVEIGSIVTVTTSYASLTSTRFVGRITDLGQQWQDAGQDTPDRVEMTIVATSVLAELGRRVVGDAPWIQQLDGARVAQIMSAAGIVLDPLFSDPGTVQILARDVDSQPALDVAQETAQDARGVLWDTRAGEIRYADASHRRGTTPSLTLDACDVLVTPTWTRTTAGLVNDVSIGYGATPDGGEQPRYLAKRDDSIAKFGRFGLSTTTQLAALADAEALGQMLLVRNREPVWIMSDLPVDVDGLSQADTTILLGLEIHDLVELTGLPSVGTAPTSTSLWVEGWSETLAWGIHDMTLTVSGYCRTSPAPRWNDVRVDQVWDAMGSTTWDDATCFGPIPSAGRWDDVPATTRWDLIPPAITWDTYA
jgi:hypothetical protein